MKISHQKPLVIAVSLLVIAVVGYEIVSSSSRIQEAGRPARETTERAKQLEKELDQIRELNRKTQQK